MLAFTCSKERPVQGARQENGTWVVAGLRVCRANIDQCSCMSQLGTPCMGARECILAVDDDASVLETTRNMLDDLGYQAMAADNLDAALSTLSHQAIDVAIIDLAMPDVSGLNVGLELQRQQPGLPIVYCSGYPDLIEKPSKHMNGSLLLSKPFFSKELSAKLEAMLRTSRLLDSDAAPNPRGLNQYRSSP